jgi:heme-degrading monooxygenase HmoA
MWLIERTIRMVEFVWEFIVKEQARGQFELSYGPGGAWSKLFAQCTGFRGTTLLRDTKDPRRYLAIDLWDTEAQREQALAEHMDEFADLLAAMTEWTESTSEVGSFRILAEATVRPRGKQCRRGRKAAR